MVQIPDYEDVKEFSSNWILLFECASCLAILFTVSLFCPQHCAITLWTDKVKISSILTQIVRVYNVSWKVKNHKNVDGG